MIGRIFELYCAGVADSRAGIFRPRRKGEADEDHTFYLLGHTTRRRRNLPRPLEQLELNLWSEHADGSQAIPD